MCSDSDVLSLGACLPVTPVWYMGHVLKVIWDRKTEPDTLSHSVNVADDFTGSSHRP